MNTFNLMYALLRTPAGAGETRRLILYLSAFFRYLLRSDSDMETFDKEMSLIEGYIQTAKLRYPDGLEFSSHIQPEARLVKVPPLLIHNFVENVVGHALVPGRCVNIVLTAVRQEGSALFEISDDGSGMSREQVEAINGRQWEEAHVGIHNAFRRLEALYGEKAGMRVDSHPGEGTVVRIQIPCEMEGEP